MVKRIGVLTGGGDAPGLNAVIRAVVLTADRCYGWEVAGIREGFDGLLAGAPLISLTPRSVHDLLARGGTILGAANRGSPFARPVTRDDGTVEYEDRSYEALERMNSMGLDALIVAGGEGTMSICDKLIPLGVKAVGVPKTIDNDLDLTEATFGFDTAISTATEALDKLQTTAESHHRVMVLEVMGRDAGWIALKAGVSGGADAILIPEIPFDIQVVCDKVNALKASGRRYSLIVVAEGAAPKDGTQSYYTTADQLAARLGGMGHTVGNLMASCVDAEVRVTVLGHLQRGGQPTPHDRWLATQFGSAAVHLVAQEKWGHMVAMQGGLITEVSIADAIRHLKQVDPQGDLVQMARNLGIVFG